MNIFSVTFDNVWKQLTPPALRQPLQLAWGKVLVKPVQYLRDLVLDDYANGSPYAKYDNTSSYTVDNRVIYIDRAVYQCYSATTPGINPFNSGHWTKINDCFIGARERVLYNSQKKLFEYTLNKWFQCSGIYIETLAATTPVFLMGNTGPNSSVMTNSGAYATNYMLNSYNGNVQSDYMIWVPLSAYTPLGSTNTERENTIRSFADRYNLAGMIYSVSGY
jgi:hypothetical protein